MKFLPVEDGSYTTSHFALQPENITYDAEVDEVVDNETRGPWG